jgi:hypothetical protein
MCDGICGQRCNQDNCEGIWLTCFNALALKALKHLNPRHEDNPLLEALAIDDCLWGRFCFNWINYFVFGKKWIVIISLVRYQCGWSEISLVVVEGKSTLIAT